MRDYFNPLVLLAVVGLFAWGMAGDGDAGVWVLVLCVTAFLVNGALSLARLFARRLVLMGVVWTVAYLILSSCAWVMLQTPATDVYEDEKNELAAQLSEWKELGKSPFASAQQERDCLVVLAAENGQRRSLLLLPEKGVSADAAGGGCFSAEWRSHSRTAGDSRAVPDTVLLILSRRLPINVQDGFGNTPLHAACMYGNLPMVEKLLSKGANPHLKSHAEKTAPDYARQFERPEIVRLLENIQK